MCVTSLRRSVHFLTTLKPPDSAALMGISLVCDALLAVYLLYLMDHRGGVLKF